MYMPCWLQWHIPCKHFFTIFWLVEGWVWNALPETYKRSARLSAHSKTLSEQQILQSIADEAVTEQDISTENEGCYYPTTKYIA